MNYSGPIEIRAARESHEARRYCSVCVSVPAVVGTEALADAGATAAVGAGATAATDAAIASAPEIVASAAPEVAASTAPEIAAAASSAAPWSSLTSVPGSVAGDSGGGLFQTLTSALGSGLQMYGNQQQADYRAAQSTFQQEMAQRQEAIAEQQAQMARDKAAADVQNAHIKTRAAIGSLRARAAANGVDLDSGSPLDLQSDAASQGELNAETIQNDGERQAWNLDNEAGNSAARAASFGADAENARQMGNLNTISSAIKLGPTLFNALA